ncbi:diphthine--ammonia ligase [Bacillus sp. B-jedd]|uniref:Dph6-related ATP pyrophosphatase n=1 Tax=Bacillus sp. B-jedd TaxID=1476857 RepID=UPI000515605D|nr:diphthine--ammonia ligase [Bacillus sp. B-jedd]CEG26460.1 ATP-binding region [Bacillus sp. B-jedd]
MKERIAVSWSGGKDSGFATYKLLQEGNYIVDSLFTTITEDYQRVSIHGIRENLLEKQAESLGLPLRKMYIPKDCPNEVYQQRMDEMLESLQKEGITAVMFGDILLEDVRSYRENLVRNHGLKAIFPLWGLSTNKLIKEFTALGFKTITTCVDTEQLPSKFLGQVIDDDFLKELPEKADPCGENGEFHTFLFEGPLFKKKIDMIVGGKREDGRFHFCDLHLDS